MKRRVIVAYETFEELVRAMRTKTSTFHKNGGRIVIEGENGLYIQSEDDSIELGGELKEMPVKQFIQNILTAQNLPVEIRS